MCGYIYGKRKYKCVVICVVIYKGNMWYICVVIYMLLGNRWYICVGIYWEYEGYICIDMSVGIYEKNEVYMCGYILGIGCFYVWEYIMVKYWG